MDPPAISIRGLVRTFRARGGARIRALDLPRLDVDRGEGVVVTGPNGSGKSTLVHLVAGLLRPDAGTIAVLGQDLGALSEARLDAFRARTIGCLLQDTPLLDFATAEENVGAARAFFPDAPAGAASVAHLLARFGLAHRARHLPGALSGGERQRLALAVAFANDPPILLADEPARGLDLDGRRAVRALLREARETMGKTVLVVSHHREEVPEAFRVVDLGAPADGHEVAS